MVDLILHKGEEEARNQLPDLLGAAEKGHSTIIYQTWPSSCSSGADRGAWRCHSPAAADACRRIRSRVMGKEEYPHASKAARVTHDRDFSRVCSLRIIS